MHVIIVGSKVMMHNNYSSTEDRIFCFLLLFFRFPTFVVDTPASAISMTGDQTVWHQEGDGEPPPYDQVYMYMYYMCVLNSDS